MDQTDHDEATELLEIAEALREHLRWSQQVGTWGLAASAEQVAPEPTATTAVAGLSASRTPSASRSVMTPNTETPSVQQATPQVVTGEQPSLLSRTSQRRSIFRYADWSFEQRQERLQQLESRIGGCTGCPLYSSRRNPVFGQGRPLVDLMIVGEGPGAQEDLQGLPFVGKSGQLLNRMIAAIGLSRDDIYIANIVKCRPPNNRNPSLQEIKTCFPVLKEQIALVQPKVILAMGNTALFGLIGRKGIRAMRGRWMYFRGEVLLMPTYHPAYVLRNESAKGEVWQDLKAVAAALGVKLPSRSRG